MSFTTRESEPKIRIWNLWERNLIVRNCSWLCNTAIFSFTFGFIFITLLFCFSSPIWPIFRRPLTSMWRLNRRCCWQQLSVFYIPSPRVLLLLSERMWSLSVHVNVVRPCDSDRSRSLLAMRLGSRWQMFRLCWHDGLPVLEFASVHTTGWVLIPQAPNSIRERPRIKREAIKGKLDTRPAGFKCR